jgi:hypothetical protein
MCHVDFSAARSLSRLYIASTTILKDTEASFNELTASCDPALVIAWEKESTSPKQNQKGEWESVYPLKAHWDQGILFPVAFLLPI